MSITVVERRTHEEDVETFCSNICTDTYPEWWRAKKLLDEEVLYAAVDTVLMHIEYDEEEMGDEGDLVCNEYWEEIIQSYSRKKGGIPISAVEELGYDRRWCDEHKIIWYEDKDEEGNEVKYVEEAANQMVFFPELEEGMPRYRYRVIVRKKEEAA
jgi:hypothetical protein